MDPARLMQVIDRLDLLDDRLTHKVRPRSPVNMGRLTPELMAERVRHLSEYSVELKEIVRDLVDALKSQR